MFLIFSTLITHGQKLGDSKTEYWVDLSYINCLKNNLPCNCVKTGRKVAPSIIKYSLNSFDSLFFDKRQRILNFSNQNNDVFSFDLRDIMSEFKGDSIIVAHVEIKYDTLFYLNYNDSILYKYIPIEKNYWTILDSISVQRINKILLKNNQENIYKILNSDSLGCYCDIQLGYNFITDEHNQNSKSWIVEIHENEIVFYKLKLLRIKRFTMYRKSHFPHKKKVYKRIKY